MLFCLLKASGRVRARTTVDWEQVAQSKRGPGDGRTDEGGVGEYYRSALNFR